MSNSEISVLLVFLAEKSWGKDRRKNGDEEKHSCYVNVRRQSNKRGMGVGGGRVWEEKPQGRLSLFVFPLPSTGQTVTRKTRGKSERRRREGLQEAKRENKS